MFEVSEAKREVLEKMVQRDWAPTELAEELNKSPQSVYNHLKDLEKTGVLSKEKVKAKTRPKTKYSIDRGFVQYISVLPGELTHRRLKIDINKESLFRIWSIPQEEIHPYLEKLWWEMKEKKEIKAIAVYGSVARGQADEDSDIDLLIITEDKGEGIRKEYGSKIIETRKGSKIAVAQVYSKEEYERSKEESDFLKNIQREIHVIYDPDKVLLEGEEYEEESNSSLSQGSGTNP